MSNGRAFVFVGGGTGGHLFPGLAIARQIQVREPDAIVHFLCSGRPLDGQILGDAGVSFECLQAQPMSVKPRGLVRFLAGWGPSVRGARQCIQRLKKEADEVVVIAMGGFVAAPGVQAGRVERVQSLLVNLDAVPGKANRWIAGRVDRVLSAVLINDRDWQVTGPIVRPEALAATQSGEARRAFGLDEDRPTLLITGGSQGAGSINAMMLELIGSQPGLMVDDKGLPWQVIHQTGMADNQALVRAYEGASVKAWVGGFIEGMGDAWSAADLAIGRSGAGIVAEAWANRVPAIFMPYPHHRDQHQRINALALEGVGGAVIVEDVNEPRANRGAICQVLSRLMHNRAALSEMGKALEQLGPADGAKVVAGVLLDEMVGSKARGC